MDTGYTSLEIRFSTAHYTDLNNSNCRKCYINFTRRIRSARISMKSARFNVFYISTKHSCRFKCKVRVKFASKRGLAFNGLAFFIRQRIKNARHQNMAKNPSAIANFVCCIKYAGRIKSARINMKSARCNVFCLSTIKSCTFNGKPPLLYFIVCPKIFDWIPAGIKNERRLHWKTDVDRS